MPQGFNGLEHQLALRGNAVALRAQPTLPFIGVGGTATRVVVVVVIVIVIGHIEARNRADKWEARG